MENRSVWTIMKILDWTKQYFADKGIENPHFDAAILLCAVLKCDRITLYVDFARPLSDEELSAFRKLVVRRVQHEPVAYILGEKGFMKHSFKVTPDVLVPRPETELLAESIIKDAEGAVRILDIGTGSGAIIISLLAALPDASGVGTDISENALAVAEENAACIGVSERLKFLCSNIYTNLSADEKFDIIVSNPPYIPSGDMKNLASDVRMEPVQALDGGDDGLDFYCAIIKGAKNYLIKGGLLAFEIGADQAGAVTAMCEEEGFKTVVRRDYAGLDRMVFAAEEGGRYGNMLPEIAK
ncbi:MAG: peptide chain release factor N(5)-glutamine methyltransferase [Phascolarctobacterium sp.]|nr:peptide chain release factor N(5)-glutamine methyltransferase [Phascolarctobacterium sp.]